MSELRVSTSFHGIEKCGSSFEINKFLPANFFKRSILEQIGDFCRSSAQFSTFRHMWSPTPTLRRAAAISGCKCRVTGEREHNLKLVIATIKPFKLEEVREALSAIGVRGMMVQEIKGFGAQSGHTEIYRGAEYTVNFVPKIRLETAVPSAIADEVIETIANTARTGKIGDGKIFAIDIAKAVRVRTGETNDDAL
jgi:nitrogen regulatory protein P-II 1